MIELSLFRKLWDPFQPTDIVLSDCLYCTWTDLLLLKQRGVDSVKHLQTLQQLQVLDVTHTHLSRDGIKQLREALPDAKIIG